LFIFSSKIAVIKRIPFFVRGHATTKTVERVAKQYPELYAVAKRQGDLPEKEREELRKIMTAISVPSQATSSQLPCQKSQLYSTLG